MLIFQTPTTLDLRAITTMGLNAKPDNDSPIGYFGTGLKYAVAAGLRLGLRIRLFIGHKEYSFHTKLESFRGKDFQMLYMRLEDGLESNDLQLPYTTEYGKNWELWMIYRELWSNTKDEGGTVGLERGHEWLLGESTTITVEGLDDIHAQRGDFLIEDTPRWSSTEVDIHYGPSSGIFYKGIRVAKLENRSIMKYNIQEQLRLTEDRTLDYTGLGSAKFAIAKSILRTVDDKRSLYAILNKRSTWEGQMLDFDWSSVDPNPTFLEVARDMYYTRPDDVNETIHSMLARVLPDFETRIWIEPSALETRTIERANAFLKRIDSGTSYPIRIVEDLGPGVLACAEDGTIVLTKELLMKGTKYVAGAIMEEHVHLAKGYHDCSRNMQNWLFDKIIHLGEEITGEPL